MSSGSSRGRARASARRERIEADVSGRRLVSEARREAALRAGEPVRRGPLAKLREMLRHRPS